MRPEAGNCDRHISGKRASSRVRPRFFGAGTVFQENRFEYPSLKVRDCVVGSAMIAPRAVRFLGAMSRTQLIANRHKTSLGKRVVATGSLFGAIRDTITPVLLTVSNLEQAHWK